MCYWKNHDIVKTEIDDFYVGEHNSNAPQIIAPKRKNTKEHHPEIDLKNIKQEVSLFEESTDIFIVQTGRKVSLKMSKQMQNSYSKDINDLSI